MEKEVTKSEKHVVYQRPNHFSYLQCFRECRKFCDIEIEVEGENFYAHKIILSTIPFFEKMFLAEFKESKQEKVTLQKIKASNMKIFIEFAYSGQIVFTEDNIESLMLDADFFGLKDLTDEGAKFLESCISVKNIRKLRRLTSVVACEKLQEKTEKFLLQNFLCFEKTEDFLLMSFDYLKEIISNDDLQVPSEEYVFEAVLKWTRGNVDERLHHLPELLASMRLFSFTAEYLVNNILKNELVASVPECRELVNSVIYSRIISKERTLFNGINVTRRYTSDTGNKRILIISRTNLSLMEIYNPITDTWEKLTSNQKSRMFLNSAVLKDNLYTVGGELSSFSSIEVYEPHNNRWKEISVMGHKRGFPRMVGLDEYLYICGGYDGENYLDSVERFCPKTGEWETMAPMKNNRQAFGVVAFQKYIYVFGGYNRNSCLKLIERYDPDTNEWTVLKTMMNKDRYHFGLAVLNDKIYLCGGRSPGTAALNSVEVFNPVSNTLTYVEKMNTPRRGLMVVAYMGKIWAIGGCDGMDDLSTVEIYDPETDIWSYGAPLCGTQPWACGGVIPIY